MKLSLLLILLMACISCNIQVNLDEQSKVSAKPFRFPSITNLTGSVFDSGSNVVVTATAIDKEDNAYILTNFTGAMNGIPSENRDVAILKMNSSGTLLWKIHFNTSHLLISDASLDEKSTSMIWDENEKALYFMGSTLSSLIEPNISGESDLFIGKVSGSGNVLWIRHYGQTTITGPGLDVTKVEAPGTLALSPDNKLVVTFETYGAFFEASAGDADIAVMKLDPITGHILSGRQLGGPTLTAYGILHSIPVNGTLRDGLTTGNMAFDGTKVVVPIRTRSSLVETNPNTANAMWCLMKIYPFTK